MEMTDRDKLIIDMYADVQVIKDSVGKLETVVNANREDIEDIKKDIHAVKMSGRILKAVAAIIGAIAGIAANWIAKMMGNG